VRLRQAVLVASELEPAVVALMSELGLQEPFRDPGVAEFGLVNAVFALGDSFLEVVSPTRPDAPAARYLKRRGADSGYMAIFDLEDLEGARERVRRTGVRVVWQIDLPDISTTHLHPLDMGGAIVSLDRSRPYGTWRWGGPGWTGKLGSGAAGRLAGIAVAVDDPYQTAARWAAVLGAPQPDAARPTLRLENAQVAFIAGEPATEGVCEVAIELPAGVRRGRDAIEFGAVRLRLLEASG
jgi:Glyoxalase-like domain